jgi:hypothetical protein
VALPGGRLVLLAVPGVLVVAPVLALVGVGPLTPGVLAALLASRRVRTLG